MADSVATRWLPRVLVVEDDRGVTRMLEFALREAGFQVRLVASGREALSALQGDAVDAVVLDLGLPDGQGSQVLEWLRRRRDHGNAGPVWVVMSAMDRQEAARQFGPVGGHFLAKPFNPWELARLLNQLLGQ
jgi:DNA-binding response OmpR family regulator